MKKLIALFLCGTILLGLFTGCYKVYRDSGDADSVTQGSSSKEVSEEISKENTEQVAYLEKHFPSNGDAELLNFRSVTAGEEVAVLKTSMGTIKIMLFPEVAPKAVENFKALIQEGYYNDITFHRVIENFMIQSGDPTGTGAGGESSFQETYFEDEFSEKALHFRGALSMANTGEADTNSSQFFIVQAPVSALPKTLWDQLGEQMGEYFPESVQKQYENTGGTPWLDFHYTVFGQVYDGMDVVDKIAKVKTGNDDAPKEEVKLISAWIEKVAE